jgi:hypothetical protein
MGPGGTTAVAHGAASTSIAPQQGPPSVAGPGTSASAAQAAAAAKGNMEDGGSNDKVGQDDKTSGQQGQVVHTDPIVARTRSSSRQKRY